MAKILLNNPDNSPDKKEPVKQPVPPVNEKNTVNTVVQASNQDDFAVFPAWDVIPPNSIINPRIKKKL